MSLRPRILISFGVLVVVFVGLVAGIFLIRQPQDLREEASGDVPISCVGEAHEIVVNFEGTRLRSNIEEDSTAGPFQVNLPKGLYKVTLTSYDDLHPDSGTQPQEQWYAILGNELNGSVLSTGTISDLPDADKSITEVVNAALSIPEDITILTLHHPAYYNENPNSVHPVCAIFSPYQISPTPTPRIEPSDPPTPTLPPASGSPTPSPSPTTSPTPTITASASPTPSPTTSSSPTSSPTPTPTTTASASPTNTSTPTSSNTPTPGGTNTPSSTPDNSDQLASGNEQLPAAGFSLPTYLSTGAGLILILGALLLAL